MTVLSLHHDCNVLLSSTDLVLELTIERVPNQFAKSSI